MILITIDFGFNFPPFRNMGMQFGRGCITKGRGEISVVSIPSVLSQG